jgi:hypothetical protein
MYDSNTFAADTYADVPIFSRAHAFDGTLEELKARIDGLAAHYAGAKNARIGGGAAEIQQGGYRYEIRPVEGNAVKAALIVQSVPAENGS